ncbi:MAG: family 20 glycosylhydrolase [Phycisphaeraceae bacterium]|nr:family 20 glycosylhydrolase [Phycisphaeraceae bacterium]
MQADAAEPNPTTVPLVPRPKRLQILPGTFVADQRLDRERAELANLLTGSDVRRGPVGSLPGARLRWIDSRPDHSTHPEAYDLRVEAGGVTIHAKQPGARHALATLTQIVRWAGHQPGGAAPAVRVLDEPAFQVRGLLLDVSRNKVPTMDSLRAIIDTLASLKFNHLQLYTEHTFAYSGASIGLPHEEVWRGTGAITPEEARELDAYAAERGVSIAANQNCFGHLSAWLQHPAYAHLAEIEGQEREWTFMQWPRRGPFSLCPTEPTRAGAIEFVRDLLTQLTPCFGSALVNINADETFDVGQGRSRVCVEERASELVRSQVSTTREEAKHRARGELYFEFVGSISRIVADLGKTPMLWADGVLSHPDLIDRLPRNAVPLVWGYEPEFDFAAALIALAKSGGQRAWVCPGTSAWRSITGRTSESRANIRRAVREGLSLSAGGFMVCEWGDVGHTQHWPVSLARIADAAEAAWAGAAGEGAIADERAVSMHLLSDPTGSLASWISALGDVDLPLRRHAIATYAPMRRSGDAAVDAWSIPAGIKNASAMFNDLFPPVPPPIAPPFGPGTRAVGATRAEWVHIRERLEALASVRPRSEDALINDELEHTLVLASLALEHAISHRPDDARAGPFEALETGRLSADERRRLAMHAGRWLEEHRRLWPLRNRTGSDGRGLAESCSHMERVIERLEAGL